MEGGNLAQITDEDLQFFLMMELQNLHHGNTLKLKIVLRELQIFNFSLNLGYVLQWAMSSWLKYEFVVNNGK
jgi:hypothetical protein